MAFSKRLLSFVAGAVALALLQAAPASARFSPPAAPFDWSGFHVGAYLGYSGGLIAGTRVGYSITRDRLVLGLEGGVGVVQILGFVEARARAGVLVRPHALAYTAAGVLYAPAFGFTLFTIAGGVEYAVANDLGVFGEVVAGRPIGGPPVYALILQAGVNWRPGR